VSPTILIPTPETLEQFTKQELFQIIQQLVQKITTLEEKVATLSKNSSTSSKPPSSDIVKPPKSSSSSGKSGGQKGHPGFWRQLFKPDEIDEVKEYRLSECPDCRIPLGPDPQTQPWIQHTAELPEKLTHITEHRRFGYVCPQCHKQHYACLPEGIHQGELFGPRLQSLVAYLKGALHGSYTSLEEFMGEVFHLDVSRSMLCDQIRTVSQSLA